ncbi:hypothetical protein QYE76_019318 [Lolium multiflorum]|uniref:CCHC-type domain-containing protein n=1 Tax=Lolium multiflorum TaxID=4521 RepID=A0AAD8R3R4_LOLMU|nr:hypothetical protein QYE76_019318 [Lolium multiflorum]
MVATSSGASGAGFSGPCHGVSREVGGRGGRVHSGGVAGVVYRAREDEADVGVLVSWHRPMCTRREGDVLGLVTMGNGMLVLVNHLLSSTKDHVWQGQQGQVKLKDMGKPKDKGNLKKGDKKAAAPPKKPKDGPQPDTVCYYCKGDGHWKRNCSKYLADLKNGNIKKKGIFDIHVIDVYLTTNRSSAWVFDTGSVAHICYSKQELRNKQRLVRDEVTMRIGNGSKMDVKMTFLNGDIEEELYMVQPKGFVDPKDADKQAGEIDNLTVKLGQSILIVLCRFHVGAGIPGVAPHYTPSPTTFTWPSSPTGSINLAFLLRENLLLYASHLPFGVPNGRVLHRHKELPSGAVAIPAAATARSAKQSVVANSSTESEYIAALEASQETIWMKEFISELGVVPSELGPMTIYCDNMGAIANAQEPRSHKKLKHIKLRFHSIREYVQDGDIKICKVYADRNVSDPLTKPFPRAKHDQYQNAMGVRYITI